MLLKSVILLLNYRNCCGQIKMVRKKAQSRKKRQPEDANGTTEQAGSSETPASKKRKGETDSPAPLLKNKSDTQFDNVEWECSRKTKDGRSHNLKIATWNVDGIRAWFKKGGFDYLKHEKPDVLCLQETKCSKEKLPPELQDVEGYHSYWLSGEKEGYAGVGLMSKTEPITVTYGMNNKEMDKDGRVITAEYKDFFLVTSYVPNSGRQLVTLPTRMKWEPVMKQYLKDLDSKKPVVFCGDLNVSHQEIDLKNPKPNKRNAGFTQEERDCFTDLLSEGFTDTYRHLYPDVTGAYTFWTYMGNARAKNVGWRLDYFVLSQRFVDNVCDCIIRKDVYGSDHCPLLLTVAI